ncbi:hypothetical protein BZG73_15665, partial [Salinivibrio siamensis]
VLNIMAMGLSRFTALHLSNASDATSEALDIDEYVLNIMAMGLSRFTALHLSNASDATSEALDIDEYFNKIKVMDVRNLQIPSLCKQEILKMQGKSVRLASANK